MGAIKKTHLFALSLMLFGGLQPSFSTPITSNLSNSLGTIPSKLKEINSHATKSIQLGWFSASQGHSQNILISGLIGDQFSVTQRTDSNGLVGVNYYIDGNEIKQVQLSYGINAFYLAKTNVNGLVTQEQLFTNLSYNYATTNYPIFVAVKALVKNPYAEKAPLKFDIGIGPNIIKTSNVSEKPLDNITLPDQTYSGKTTTAFSAMAGAGIRINQVFGKAPLECGYRFMYLGQGGFNKTSNQLLDTFKTGHAYANAVLCSIEFA